MCIRAVGDQIRTQGLRWNSSHIQGRVAIHLHEATSVVIEDRWLPLAVRVRTLRELGVNSIHQTPLLGRWLVFSLIHKKSISLQLGCLTQS